MRHLILKYVFILGFISVVSISCSTTKPKTQLPDFEWNLDGQTLVFYAQTATPLPDQMLMSSEIQRILPPGSSANNIQLNGNSNFIVFSKDSIQSFLPYYGRVFMTNGVNPQKSALELVSTQFKVQKQSSRKGITYINWTFNDQRDLNQMQISVGKNGYATVQCRFNFRQPISFYGQILKK